jgi:anti-sigma factor RsiW
MECFAPGTISDDDLLRYTLDPEDLSAEARQHFDECPACRARAADYRSVSTDLATRLHRWDCPTTLTLSEFAAGLLTGKERKQVEEHLKHCLHCSEEAAISREFLAAPTAAAPQRPLLKASLPKQQHVLEAYSGVRGENLWPHQYTIDGISLSLHLAPPSPPGAGASLIGLISRLDTSLATLDDIEVHLLPTSMPDQPVPQAARIKLNNFLFQHIPPGTYELLIALPEGNLLIKDIELRQ